MPTLPSNVNYGQVIGQLLEAWGDGSITPGDPDVYPDAKACTGSIRFTAQPTYVVDATATPNPVTIFPKTVTCKLDGNGYLIDPDGNQGVYLVADDDPDLNPTGWTWNAYFNLDGIPQFDRNFSVGVGQVVDLATILGNSIPSSGGTAVIVTPSAVISVDGGAGAVDLTQKYGRLSTRRLKTGAYNAVNGDLVACDTTAGTFAVTLPLASAGKARVVVKWVAGTAAPTVALSGSDKWNYSGGSSTPLTPQLMNQGYVLDSDGSGIWTIIADDLPLGQLDLRYPSFNAMKPVVSGKAAGLLYNGSDESATISSIFGSMAAFGIGTLVLEGITRCDPQLTMPTTTVGGQVRQAPFRVTSNAAQFAPGSTYSGPDPFPGAGFDLRYAGRTDTGVTTTLGSAIVGNTAAVATDAGNLVTGPGIPDNTWILASDVGTGWTLSKAARATGTVTVVSMGGRIQSLGYGTLQMDHLTFLSGAATSAPFGISTATRMLLDDNVFVGTTTKSGSTCDEDPWVFGGTGQGTNLTTALTSGNTYTSINVKALPVGLVVGRKLTIGAGHNTQQVTIAAPLPNTGDTTVNVSSFVANANYPLRTGVAFASSMNQSLATSWSVPASYHQGFASRMIGNQFYSCRRIGIGGFATDLVIDRNAWMHNCGSNVAAAPSTLTSALVAGTNYTALQVTGLSVAAVQDDVIQVAVGDGVSMEFVVSAAGAAQGATTVPVNSQNATYAAAIGTVAFNSTAGIGAAIYSYADFVEANTVHIGYNRMGVSGGYNYMTRFDGATVNSVIVGNDLQDMQADPNFIACHRFGRGSSNNTVITGLQGTGNIVVDDWSASSGALTTVIIDPVRQSRFPLGIKLGGDITLPGGTGVPAQFALIQLTGMRSVDPITTGWSWTDLAGTTTFLNVSGGSRTFFFKGAIQLDGNSVGAGTTYLTIGNNSTASDALITFNAPTGQAGSIQWKYAGTNRWLLYNGASNGLFLRDSTNNLMFLTFTAGSGTTGLMDVQAGVRIQGKVGFNGTTPITKPTATPTDAVDLATAMALVNYLKNSVVLAYGLAA